MIEKNKNDSSEYISKREATLLLGFKNTRSIAELIKKKYLKTYIIDSSKREVLKKSEVLNLPQKDPPKSINQ
jgi:hypothetical protein